MVNETKYENSLMEVARVLDGSFIRFIDVLFPLWSLEDTKLPSFNDGARS